MFSLSRFFKNVLTALAQEFGDNPFNGMMSIANYQDEDFEAVVTRSISPGKAGQVEFKGSWWTARCNREVVLVPGQIVYVVVRRDNTLYVEPGFMLRAMLPILDTVTKTSHS
ncbi:NfeD family protein [Kovacikia minuta CCNUW1]|uniref:NfeD family protein n=1 Tax=Kovacikia minuta TaxID=2931930 RepID=UPI001CCC2CDA|nr:NfeD family protein [Kovacikia minuta]UBF24541.1 NfeD family protein [Kovacikia minuta CCNUW1]